MLNDPMNLQLISIYEFEPIDELPSSVCKVSQLYFLYCNKK